MSSSIAVLMATYNGAAFCKTQLISILWQCGVDVHVYARDDGSHDATTAILAQWAERYPDRMTIVNNGGVSTGSANGNFFALLAAVDPAQHDYLAFADQDDVWTPDKLARAIDRMSATGAQGYSSDLIAYHADSGRAWMLHKAGRPADLDYLFQGASAGCTYVLTREAALLARKLMAQAPPFPPDASHDWILYAICRSHGLAWVRDPISEILYRQHDGNQYGAKRGWRELRAKLKVVRSSWYRNHILWLRHVVVNSDSERQVFDALARGRLSDRWWLIRNSARFRRTRGYVAQLRAVIALRMI